MKYPLLFSKRRHISVEAAAQYVGTDTEIDIKISGIECASAKCGAKRS